MSNSLPKKFHLADDNLNAVAYYRADIVVRMAEAMIASIDMIENCADAPKNTDSLPEMVKAHLQQALSAWEEAEQYSQLAVNEALNRGDADVLR